jgi:hypothetical protein
MQTSKFSTSALASLVAGTANLIDRWRYFRKRDRLPIARPPSAVLRKAISELRTSGYAIIPDYYSQDLCRMLISEIDRILVEQSDIVQTDKFGADKRIFGAERASPAIAEYNRDPLPISVGEAYGKIKLTAFCTLAGRITPQPGNIGSGQGWHRDAFHFQYKSMVYLTDVTADSGPFQILEGSHNGGHVFSDTIRGRLPRQPYSRITDAQAERVIAGAPARLKSVTAPAGTMILFDSSTIHRGAPINAGMRYALTNYYFEPKAISPATERAFAPFAHAASER